jgi:hypothetical protein
MDGINTDSEIYIPLTCQVNCRLFATAWYPCPSVIEPGFIGSNQDATQNHIDSPPDMALNLARRSNAAEK